jgi:hypothetical protein
MPDISKCKGEDCPMKETCYRFTANANEFMQSYFMNAPIKEDDSCEYYWDNTEYPTEGTFHIKL